MNLGYCDPAERTEMLGTQNSCFPVGKFKLFLDKLMKQQECLHKMLNARDGGCIVNIFFYAGFERLL